MGHKFKVGDKVYCKSFEDVFTVVGCHTDGTYWVSRTGNLLPHHDGEKGSLFEFDSAMELVEPAMKYQDKWILNEGQEIPENADKLEKDGSVVAYRLPVREIQVGDIVTCKGSIFDIRLKVLYVYEDYVWVSDSNKRTPLTYPKSEVGLVD